MISRAFLVMAAIAMSGSMAWAEPQGSDVPPGYVPADWKKKPTQSDLVAVWPAEAYKRGQGGKAVISCHVNVQGGLYDCRIVSETPAGAGFGGAAIVLTSQFLMKPATQDGHPVVSTVNIPMTFPTFTPSGNDLFFTDRVLSLVPWKAAPNYEEVAAAYPEKARIGRVPGRATLDCTIQEDGLLRGCSVAAEAPKGMGFAKAARELSARFVAPTTLPDGTSTKNAGVQLPIAFGLDMLGAEQIMVGKPKWAQLPDLKDMATGFPEKAAEAGLATGRGVIQCRIVAEGAVEDCAVTSEEPTGMGFGEAALALAPAFRMTLWTQEGLPTVGGAVTIPIRFNQAPPPAKP